MQEKIRNLNSLQEIYKDLITELEGYSSLFKEETYCKEQILEIQKFIINKSDNLFGKMYDKTIEI